MSFLTNVVLLVSTLVVLTTFSLAPDRDAILRRIRQPPPTLSPFYIYTTPHRRITPRLPPQIQIAQDQASHPGGYWSSCVRRWALSLSPSSACSLFFSIKPLCRGHVPCGRASSIHGCLPCVLPLFSSVGGAVWPGPTSSGAASRRGQRAAACAARPARRGRPQHPGVQAPRALALLPRAVELSLRRPLYVCLYAAAFSVRLLTTPCWPLRCLPLLLARWSKAPGEIPWWPISCSISAQVGLPSLHAAGEGVFHLWSIVRRERKKLATCDPKLGIFYSCVSCDHMCGQPLANNN
jgi:hypothetical protein